MKKAKLSVIVVTVSIVIVATLRVLPSRLSENSKIFDNKAKVLTLNKSALAADLKTIEVSKNIGEEDIDFQKIKKLLKNYDKNKAKEILNVNKNITRQFETTLSKFGIEKNKDLNINDKIIFFKLRKLHALYSLYLLDGLYRKKSDFQNKALVFEEHLRQTMMNNNIIVLKILTSLTLLELREVLKPKMLEVKFPKINASEVIRKSKVSNYIFMKNSLGLLKKDLPFFKQMFFDYNDSINIFSKSLSPECDNNINDGCEDRSRTYSLYSIKNYIGRSLVYDGLLMRKSIEKLKKRIALINAI